MHYSYHATTTAEYSDATDETRSTGGDVNTSDERADVGDSGNTTGTSTANEIAGK